MGGRSSAGSGGNYAFCQARECVIHSGGPGSSKATRAPSTSTSPMNLCTTVSTRTPWSGCGAACTRRGAGTWCSRRRQGIPSARSPAGITRRAITARSMPATLTCSCSPAACRRRTGSRTLPRRSSLTLAPIWAPGTVSSRSNGPEERTGLRPRYRRAFGCVTWVYMGMLVFLAANFLLVLPSRYLGSGELYRFIPPALAYLGTLLILPGMVLAALLGARTFRTPRKRGTRVGAGVGALIGYSGFFGLAWLAIALGLNRRDQAFRTVAFPDLGGSLAFYAFVPLTLLAMGLVINALYSKAADFEQQRRLVIMGTVLAVLAGLGVVVTDFDPLGVLGTLISTLSGAIGGYVSGAGYARAGGDDMIPPGSQIRRREPRRKPR